MKVIIDEKTYILKEQSKSYRKMVAFLKSLEYFSKIEYNITDLENEMKELTKNQEKLCDDRNELYTKYRTILSSLLTFEQSSKELIEVNNKIEEIGKNMKTNWEELSNIKQKLCCKKGRYFLNKIEFIK